MTRTKKAIKNSMFSILQQIVNIITNIILPPIIIATFGSAINGLIATIKELMGYAQLVGAGLSAAATESLYKPLADDDKKSINGSLNAINKSFTNTGIWFSIIIFILSCVYPYFLGRNEVNYFTITLLTLVIGITGASEFFIIGKYRTLLTADQKIFVVSITQMVGNIVNVIVTLGLIYLKQDIIIVQLVASIIYASRTAILIIYVRKNYKYLDKNIEPILSATSKRKDALFHQLAGTIVCGSTTIIVSIFCGLEAASIYAIYALVFMGINSLCSIVSNALVPSFGELVAKKDKRTLNKAFNLYESIYYMLIFIFFSIALVTILPFISIYTKGTDINYINPTLAILFIIFGIGTNLKIPFVTLIVAHGHFKETKNMAITEMIINVIGQLIFVQIYGLEGVLLGSICSFIYRTIVTIVYTNKNILNISNKITIKRVVVNLVATFIPVYISSLLFDFSSNGYIEWIIKAGLLTFVISIITLILNYVTDKETINNIIIRIKNLV
jgi:O-antigen/teichoic acid export membrane protein